MRHAGLIAFGATLAVLVPAARLKLTAGPQQDALLFAPSASSLDIDGAHVEASLDKMIVDPGGAVHLKLVANKPVTVGIVVLGTTGTEGDRVSNPPLGIAHETVKLTATPEGGASKDVVLKLDGALASGAQDLPFGNYTIYVMTPKAADKLDRMRRRAHPPVAGDNEPPSPGLGASELSTLISSIDAQEAPDNKTDAKLFAAGTIARLDAYTRPKNQRITIQAPETARRDEVFTVGVTVTNPSKRKLADLEVSLELPAGGSIKQYLGMPQEAVTIAIDKVKIDLAGHETRRVEFHVTAKTAGVVGLFAHAYCLGDGCTDHQALTAGAFEATEIVNPAAKEPAPTIVARQANQANQAK